MGNSGALRGAIIAALAFAVIVAVLEWRHQKSEESLAKNFDAKVKALAARQESAERTQQFNDTVRSIQSLQPAEARVASAPRQLASGDAAAPIARNTKPPSRPEPMDPGAERHKAEAVIGNVQSVMNAERRDNAWASGIESWISSTFSANTGSGSGSRLERAECKETLCTVEAVHDDDQAYQKWMMRFSGTAQGLPQMMTMPTVLDNGATRTKTFLLKDGHQFPPRPE